MTELQILILNFSLYVVATIIFKKKFGWGNLATLAMLLYTIAALLSVLYYVSIFYRFSYAYRFGVITLKPALWLFSFDTLLCLTLRKLNFPKTPKLSSYDMGTMDLLQIFLVFVFVVIVAFGLIGAVQNFRSEALSDLREDAGTAIRSGPFFVRLLSRFLGGFSTFLLILPAVNYFVLKRRRRIDLFTVLLYFANQFVIIGNAVSRATIMFLFFEVGALVISLKEYIPAKTIKKVMIWSMPVFVLLGGFFMAVTISRFSEGLTGESEEAEVNGSFLRYAGEGMINFNVMRYDNTTGSSYFYSTFPLYRRLLGLSYAGQELKAGGTPAPANTISDAPTHIFYQCAGRWYNDLGKYLSFVLLIIINIAVGRIKSSRFNFWNLVVGIIWSLYVLAGVFWAIYSSEAYNVLYVYLVFLYFQLNGRSKDIPQEQTESLVNNVKRIT